MKADFLQITVPMLLRNVVSTIKSPQDVFLLEKTGNGDECQHITFEDTLKNADYISAWMLDNKLEKGDRVGLLAENGSKYVYFDQALQQIGGVNVSIYPTLSATEMEHIINDAKIKMILVGNHFLLVKVLKIVDRCPSIKYIVPSFDTTQKRLPEVSPNVQMINFSEVLKKGEEVFSTYDQK